MKNKLQSTRCSMRQTADTSNLSNASSRIKQRRTENPLKGLSFSLQSIKNPFPQTLPLKFPKNRIVKGFNNHMLTETQQIKFKPGLRQSFMQNQQFQQKPYKKQKAKGQFYTFNQQSFDNNISQSLQNQVRNFSCQKSPQKLHYSSLQKQSKKIFHHIITKQVSKNPITFGEIKAQKNNQSLKKIFQENQKQKNFSKGFKTAFEWNTDLSKEKQKFQNQCNALPKSINNEEIFNLNLSKSKQKKQTAKTQRKIRQIKAPKTSRDFGRQQTYTSIYNSKRKYIGL